jgi:hypothetical protein
MARFAARFTRGKSRECRAIMGWKYRNGRRYYYQSIRSGGRVQTLYVGTGPDAEGIALLAREGREAREYEWKRRKAERREEDDVEHAFIEMFDRIGVVAEAVMVAAGFHRHNRGEWRRRMGIKKSDGVAASAPAENLDPATLLRRASKGDEDCLPQLRKLLAEGPRGIVEAYGSPAQWCRDQLVQKAAGNNLAIQEASERKLKALVAELAGPDPTPIERLLAERAAVCWWLVHEYERRYAAESSMPIIRADYQQRRLDRAHRRFLTALKTLATVRRLALPSLQVNIAGMQQVNNGESR